MAKKVIAQKKATLAKKKGAAKKKVIRKEAPHVTIKKLLTRANKLLSHPLLQVQASSSSRTAAAPKIAERAAAHEEVGEDTEEPGLWVPFCNTEGKPLGPATTDKAAALKTAKAHAQDTGDNVTVIGGN